MTDPSMCVGVPRADALAAAIDAKHELCAGSKVRATHCRCVCATTTCSDALHSMCTAQREQQLVMLAAPTTSLSTLRVHVSVRHGQEEVEIRAATIVATDLICAAVNALPTGRVDGRPFAAVEVDWLLWQEGEKRNAAGEIPTHHRTLTCFY